VVDPDSLVTAWRFIENPPLGGEAASLIDEAGVFTESRGRELVVAWHTDGCHFRPSLTLTMIGKGALAVTVDTGPAEWTGLVGRRGEEPVVVICPLREVVLSVTAQLADEPSRIETHLAVRPIPATVHAGTGESP
jgi:hypothetical protein